MYGAENQGASLLATHGGDQSKDYGFLIGLIIVVVLVVVGGGLLWFFTKD